MVGSKEIARIPNAFRGDVEISISVEVLSEDITQVMRITEAVADGQGSLSLISTSNRGSWFSSIFKSSSSQRSNLNYVPYEADSGSDEEETEASIYSAFESNFNLKFDQVLFSIIHFHREINVRKELLLLCLEKVEYISVSNPSSGESQQLRISYVQADNNCLWATRDALRNDEKT
mmetsp:Transcript_21085/g.32671  ORF Transcript_21085/g.32671 Transcript_21085/m.32671 type:complete len:176 (+) Transcript_21085:196-723(+)